jgi:hypothetical protein
MMGYSWKDITEIDNAVRTVVHALDNHQWTGFSVKTCYESFVR